MRGTRLMLGALALAGALTANNAYAFGLGGGGFRVGYLDPESSDGGFLVGGHLEFEKPDSYFHIRPNIDYWNGNPLNGWNVNLDGLYHFGPQTKTVPYLGAGLGASIVSADGGGDSSTDLGVNLFGGAMFPAGGNHLFAEARYTLSEVNQASLSLGITFDTH